MKAKEKRLILILVVITIIMFAILMIVRNNAKKNQQEGTGQNNGSFVTESNGIKQNTSNKLQEAKKIADLDVTNIQITEVGGEATIRANIENNTGTDKKEFPIKVMVYSENGELLQKVGAYVGSIKAGETRAINASVNMNINSIYDIKFEK